MKVADVSTFLVTCRVFEKELKKDALAQMDRFGQK